MANPRICLDSIEHRDILLHVASLPLGDRLRRLCIVVRGTGGGKTRLLEELRRELLLVEGVLAIGITFICQSHLVPNEVDPSLHRTAEMAVAQAVATRILSSVYDIDFFTAKELMVEVMAALPEPKAGDDLPLALLKGVIAYIRASGIRADKIVLLVDETAELTEAVEKEFGVKDQFAVVRQLLNTVPGFALAASSLTVEVSGITGTGRSAIVLKQEHRLPAAQVVETWFEVERNNQHYNKALVVAAALSTMPRLLEMAAVYIKNNKDNLGDPYFSGKLIANLTANLPLRYDGEIDFFVPSGEILFAALYRTKIPVNDKMAAALRLSVLTNTFCEKALKRGRIIPEIGLFFLAMSDPDAATSYAPDILDALQELKNKTFSEVTSTNIGKILGDYFSIVLRIRLLAAASANRTISLCEALGLRRVEDTKHLQAERHDWSWLADRIEACKITAGHLMPIQLKTKATTKKGTVTAALVQQVFNEVKAHPVGEGCPLRVFQSVENDAFDCLIVKYNPDSPKHAQYLAIDLQSADVLPSDSERLLPPHPFPATEKPEAVLHKKGQQLKNVNKIFDIAVIAPENRMYLCFSSQWTQLYKRMDRGVVRTGYEEAARFFSCFWDLHCALRQGYHQPSDKK